MAHFMQHCHRGKDSVWLLWNLNNEWHGKLYILMDNKPSTVYIRKGFFADVRKMLSVPVKSNLKRLMLFN